MINTPPSKSLILPEPLRRGSLFIREIEPIIPEPDIEEFEEEQFQEEIRQTEIPTLDIVDLTENPDVTGNFATFNNLNVNGIPVAGSFLNFARMPQSTSVQILSPGVWNTVLFGGPTLLNLSLGIWLALANGTFVNNSATITAATQVRIINSIETTIPTQVVVGLPATTYAQFQLVTFIDTSFQGNSFKVQINPSTELTLLATISDTQPFTPQFSAVQLR